MKIMLNSLKMSKRCLVILMVLFHLSAAAVDRRVPDGNRKRTVTDPVSNLFSELGDLFLDVDRSFAEQIAPKNDFEDGIVSQILKPSNEYFSNVQKSYKNLQNRLGSFIRQSVGPKSTYSERDLSTVSPPAVEDITAATEAYRNVEETEQKTSPHSSSPPVEADNECSNEILTNPFVDSRIRQNCYKRLERYVDPSVKRIMDSLNMDSNRRSQIFNPFGLDEVDTFLKRSGDAAQSDSKSEGRIIGDVLYSESTFDQSIRQLLRDHGKWILDNPLLTRLRRPSEAKTEDVSSTSESSTAASEISTEAGSSDPTSDASTQTITVVTTEYTTELPKSESVNEFSARSADYYRMINDDGVVEEEIDVVLQPRSNFKISNAVDDSVDEELEDEEQQEETLILAFTADGVPLKLRMGPEIQNPILFLNRVLKSAGVSLNVPVESYDDIEPVGKEVMKLGAGVLTRAVYFNLSNSNELKSLLKSLMKSKPSKMPKF